MQCCQVYGFIQNLRIFEPQMMYSLVLGDNKKCTFMHDFWIFVRTNLATLVMCFPRNYYPLTYQAGGMRMHVAEP